MKAVGQKQEYKSKSKINPKITIKGSGLTDVRGPGLWCRHNRCPNSFLFWIIWKRFLRKSCALCKLGKRVLVFDTTLLKSHVIFLSSLIGTQPLADFYNTGTVIYHFYEVYNENYIGR